MDVTTNSTTSLVSLTRTLNSLHLAAVDAAKLEADQEAKQRSLRASIDQAAAKLSSELQDDVRRNQARADEESLAQGQQNLQQLVPPKAQLSPSDEVKLFAPHSGNLSNSAIGSDAAAAQNLSVAVNPGSAVSDDGEAIHVDIITPHADAETSAQILNLTGRAQAATAALYARNSDAVFEHASAAADIAA